MDATRYFIMHLTRPVATVAPAVLVLCLVVGAYVTALLRPGTWRRRGLRTLAAYPSLAGRDWWDDETFLGLARLRGTECRSRYAEAFTASKLTVGWAA